MSAFSAIVGDCVYLSRDEENRLARRWLTEQDPDARLALFRGLFPLLIRTVNRFCRIYNRPDVEDYESAAAAGLLHGIDRFDPDLGFRLSTYAMRASWTYMMRQLAHGVIKVPDNHRSQQKYQDAIARVNSMGTISDDMLAATTDAALLWFDGPPADSPIDLAGAIEQLTQREQLVIQARFYEGRTLKAIGDDLGVTKERVRQIEVLALKRLRQVLEPAA